MKFDFLQVKKRKIKGHGADDIGDFEIKGEIKHGEVEFEKRYHGKHTVHYKGELHDDKTIVGHWKIPEYGLEDAFEISRAHHHDSY